MTVLKVQNRKKYRQSVFDTVVVQILYFDVTIYKVSIKERMYIKSLVEFEYMFFYFCRSVAYCGTK
jgi:hypothetical protein